ncbi:MAG: hypothetical protein M3R04_05010 [bacterium]|nr:hypothetical protein [bacterium]
MKLAPLKIASTLFWLCVTAFFFYRWRLDKSNEALGFALLFLVLTSVRSYFLYREWRSRNAARQLRTTTNDQS